MTQQQTAPTEIVVPVWNSVTFTGRLGGDPEMSYTPRGTAVTRFSLAVNQGQGQEAMWLRVVCWKGLAEQVSNNQQAGKGAQVTVQGRLSQQRWKDKDGNPRTSYEVVASTVKVLDGRAQAVTADSLGDLDDHPF